MWSVALAGTTLSAVGLGGAERKFGDNHVIHGWLKAGLHRRLVRRWSARC